MATAKSTPPKQIDPAWLRRYVTKTDVFVHDGTVHDIQRRRGVTYPEALLIYFQEDDGADWNRISNAWRQKCHRERRKAEREELRNNPTPKPMDLYVGITERLRNSDIDLLESVIHGIYLHGTPRELSGVECGEHALSILRRLRNTIDDEIADIEGHLNELIDRQETR